MVGETISHYRILDRLGGGGMGVVYRAEDTKLHRPVALKFLSAELTSHEDANRRFMQEAQAASSLDHPNICTVFAIDETPDGRLFLAMRYYEGSTLQAVIDRGPMPIADALNYAVQTAQGLAKAHAEQIVHRDIKPANLLVTNDGVLKILDFGLAKLVGQTGLTQTGQALGTVAYMSPEQIQGQDVDQRTDLWSLGVVIYEMLGGQRPFTGEQAIAMANAIVHATPAPLASLRPAIPAALARIVERALAKRREDRYSSAAELLIDLQRLQRPAIHPTEETPTLPVVAASSSRLRRAKGPAAVAVIAVGGLAYFLVANRSKDDPVLTLARPVQVAASTGVENQVSWSPDGQMIAYQAERATTGAAPGRGTWDIWVMQSGGGPPINRTADYRGQNQFPRWSPDGRYLSFYSNRDGGGVFVMAPLAGTARKVCSPIVNDSLNIPTAWSPDGQEIACQDRERHPDGRVGPRLLARTTLSGEIRGRHELPGESFNQKLDLAWSPDGKYVTYVDARDYSSQITRIWLVRLADNKAIPITDGRMNEWSPTWSPDSRVLFFVSNRGGSKDLWRQRLGGDGTPMGEAERVTSGLELKDAAISPDGRRVAYSKGREVSNVWRLPILPDRPATWSDATQITFDQALIEHVALSPDRQHFMISSDRAGNPDLWMLPAAGGEMQQITMDPMPDWAPSWSPDGRSVAFYSARTGNREIWVQPVSGGAARQLTTGTQQSTYPAWSPDGASIAFERNGQICTVPPGGGEPSCLGSAARRDFFPAWSPDGRWLAFQIGTPELARMAADGGSVLRLKGGIGITNPRWSPDQEWIYFVARHDNFRNVWAITPDGKRERQLTDLAGAQRGVVEPVGLATDGGSVYIVWRADVSDVWIADLVQQ